MAEVLDGMAEIARDEDGERFCKEAMYSSLKMASRVSAKEERLTDLMSEAEAPSFLRRKRSQGKAQFEPRPDDSQ
ncbi:hypothetical protein [Niveibacterium sp. SC-1]|uniref:hypothetical protein n=1 Tax=Niveibacterium sp. SC-1 TaxID=3135646 RepID=UPI00312009B8